MQFNSLLILICACLITFSMPLQAKNNPNDLLLPIEHQIQLTENPILIINNQLELSPQLQRILNPEIQQAKQELIALSQRINLDLTQDFGIVYIHQGRNDWLIKYTFGGFILNSPEDRFYSIEEIFTIKKAFENTKFIEIQGQKYPTTGFMRQLGPILHED